MRYARLAPIAATFAVAISLLAACGGGGNGSAPPATSTAPANPPAPSNPAAPTPAASPTPAPTASATAKPVGTPSPTPAASPTPTPAVSPTPTPTPVQSTPPPGSSVAGAGVIHIGYGQTNGDPGPLLISKAPNGNGYAGGGDYEPEGQNGQQGATSTGGGQGQSVDGIACAPSMSDDYHVHIFVGIYDNGQEVAVPAGVGIVNPSPPDQSVLNENVVPPGTPNAVPNQSWTGNCFYDMHVHDNSGMVHIETADNNPQLCGAASAGSNGVPARACDYPAPYTLKTLFDIWGISVTASNFGPLQGPVTVYTTPLGYNSYSACGNSGNEVVVPCETLSSAYQLSTLSQAESMPLYSHSTFWFVIGNLPAGGLPSIAWDEGNP